MDFNIQAVYNEDFGESIWCLSEGAMLKKDKHRLHIAYFEVLSMFISDNPFMFRVKTGRRPFNGEISKGVYFSPNTKFCFRDGVLVNSHFFDSCLKGKGFIDALVGLGELALGDQKDLGGQLDRWGYDYGLYCFDVYN